MSYRINKTNGELLVELTDGNLDTVSSDITLVGKNYRGFGEFINENFVKMLENFSSTSAPSNPLKGQLWFDTQSERLKIFDGETFRTAGSPLVSDDQPNKLVAGDLWIDSGDNKLYFFDGQDLVLVGPQYDNTQGRTHFEAVTMIDVTNQRRVVLALYLGGVLAGIFSSVEFTPTVQSNIDPYPQNTLIKAGFNPVYPSVFKFHGTAITSEGLVDGTGQSFSTSDFVKTNERDAQNNPVEQQIESSLFVKGLNGVQVGYSDSKYGVFRTAPETTNLVIDLLESDVDFEIRTPSGNDQVSAVKVDAQNDRVGIFIETPETTLDVGGAAKVRGNLEITGNLTIQGDTTFINTQTLRVEDPTIELGITDDSTEQDDTGIDGGGINLRSTDGSKDIRWYNATGNWTSNQNFDLVNGKEYRIDNTSILSKTRLGDTVTRATGVTQLGTLQSLSVEGDISITDGGKIASNQALSIESTGDITINNQKIVGVADPTSSQDVATKNYADDILATRNFPMFLDITGLSDPNPAGTFEGPINDVRRILNSVYPVDTTYNGAIARIHCVSNAGTEVTGISVSVATDASATLQKSFVAVDKAGTENASVVQDISGANTTSGFLQITPSRYTMTFVVSGGVWQHDDTDDFT